MPGDVKALCRGAFAATDRRSRLSILRAHKTLQSSIRNAQTDRVAAAIAGRVVGRAIVPRVSPKRGKKPATLPLRSTWEDRTLTLFVWEIRRHKRACRPCTDGIAQVPAGEEPGGLTTPVPGSDYGFGVYTQIITNKFADHLPLYRGEDIFARAGLMIPRNTQFGMLANIAMLIAPLVELMKSRIVSGTVLGVDDTSVRMQDASLPGKMRTARFWLYRGREDHPYNVFDFTESRGRELAAAMYSLVSSAARHHLDVWASVDDCLRRLAGGSTDYASLLPDVWRSSHPEAIRPYRDIEQQSRRLTTQQRRVRRRAAKVA